jgi:hypothetical protein
MILEKVLFRGVNKDVSPKAVDGGGRKIVNPIKDALNARYLSSEDGQTFLVESIKGTTEISVPVVSGLDTCIGMYEDSENERLIVFLYNSQNNHRVIAYNQRTQTVSVLIQGAELNFSNDARYGVTGVGSVGVLLYWTDGLNPQRAINTTRTYTAPFGKLINLMKYTFTSSIINFNFLLGSVRESVFGDPDPSNKLSGENFQFSCRVIFKDNEVSPIGRYSSLSNAGVVPDFFSIAGNTIRVGFTWDLETVSNIKAVQLLVRTSNEDTWKVFRTISNVAPGTVSAEFKNKDSLLEIAQPEQVILFDSVPRKSKCLSLFKNRVFLDTLLEGFNPEDSDFNLTLSAVSAQATMSRAVLNDESSTSISLYPRFKGGGVYSVGIRFQDEFGRLSGVLKKQSITIPRVENSSPTSGNVNTLQRSVSGAQDLIEGRAIRVTLSGTPPTWARRYQLCVTKEKFYETYYQCLGDFNFVLKIQNTSFTAGSGRTMYNDGSFWYEVWNYGSIPVGFRKLFVRLPIGAAIEVKEGMFVRLMGIPSRVERIEKVLQGNIIMINGFGIEAGQWASYGRSSFQIEIFELKEQEQDIFYEVPQDSYGTFDTTPFLSTPGNINNAGTPSRAFASTGITIRKGDAYTVRGSGEFGPLDAKWDAVFFDKQRFNVTIASQRYHFVESPTPTTTKLPDIRPTSEGEVNALDYTKIDWSIGRPLIELQDEREISAPNLIRFSDPYIQNSNINGLSRFEAANFFDKMGSERSPVKKLQPAGNVLLAIHERNVTSLYVGEGYVKTGENEGILSKTDSVIGDERLLTGGFGSYHPESVAEVNGTVFGFDVYKGVVWRYTLEGLRPISDNGMKNYFRDKGQQYLPYKDLVKIVGGIDYFHKEYLISFPFVFGGDVFEAGSRNFMFANNTYEVPLTGLTTGLSYKINVRAELGNNQLLAVNIRKGSSISDNIIVASANLTVENQSVLIAELQFTNYTPSTDKVFIQVLTGTNTQDETEIVFDAQNTIIEGETWAYNYENNIWTSRYSFVPEMLGKLGNEMFSYANGKFWKHNSNETHNNFYGTQYQRKVNICVNPQPNKVKAYMGIQIACPELCETPESGFKVIKSYTEEGQETYVPSYEFEKKENVWYGPILKDINTTNIEAGRLALREGKDMRSKYLEIEVTNDKTTKAPMQFANVTYVNSEFSV